MVMSAPCARAQATNSAGGCSACGQAIRSAKLNRAAASIHEHATLLPSPTQATTWPATGPRCSSNVIISAINWQGCDLSVSPLITGTVAFAANSANLPALSVRSMIAST